MGVRVGIREWGQGGGEVAGGEGGLAQGVGGGSEWGRGQGGSEGEWARRECPLHPRQTGG